MNSGYRWGIAVILAAVVAGPAAAGNWPQFLGAERSGVAADVRLAGSWPEEGPELVWRRDIGPGFSGVAGNSDRFFTLFSAAEGDVRYEYAAAFETDSGEEIWRHRIGEEFVDEFGNGPRSTPAVRGDTVLVLSSRGVFAALTAGDGSVRWTVDFTEAFGSAVPRWGFSMSPVVDQDLVVVEIGGGEGKAFAAFDVATGETRWTAGDGQAGYSSPQAVTIAGQRQFVFLHNGGEVASVAPDGAILWTWRFVERAETVAMPVFVAPDRLLFSAPNRAGAALIEVRKKGETFSVEEVWRVPRMRNHWSNSIVADGAIYGFDNASLKCLSLSTGEQLWSQRGFGKGSLVLADGKLVVLSDGGVLLLAEASADSFKELGRVKAMDGRSWTAPAIVGGQVIVRNHASMVSYRIAEGGAR